MKEVQLEFTCIYARNYNLLLKIKENGEYQPEIMSQVRLMINKEMKDKTEQVVEDYGITLRQFEAWNEKFEDLPFLEKQREMMAKLDEDVFVNESISHLNYEDDIPEDFINKFGNKISEGTSHGILANMLSESLGRNIYFVPRIYADELIDGEPYYLKDLSAVLNPKIKV